MRRAVYGRMRLGRCVTEQYNSNGCSVNVIQQVDSLCSGRRNCKFPVNKLHDTRPCPNDLRSYLEASYECIKGERLAGLDDGSAESSEVNSLFGTKTSAECIKVKN